MRTEAFRRFLEDAESIKSKNKAVSSRISKAAAAESILGHDLDTIVVSDQKMYEALLKIQSDPREKSGNIQNALRWYYRFATGKEFPRLDIFQYSMRSKASW